MARGPGPLPVLVSAKQDDSGLDLFDFADADFHVLLLLSCKNAALKTITRITFFGRKSSLLFGLARVAPGN